jgi:hypothetical protein
MIDNILSSYEQIGWDFDGTLVEHPASEIMQSYIRAAPQKRHYIVTFRTHGLLTDLPHDLAAYRDAPPLNVFVKILSVDPDVWYAHATAEMQRRSGILKGPLTDAELLYREWKGLVCRQHGIPVMIDDNAEHVVPGCERYAVKYVHPDEFM